MFKKKFYMLLMLVSIMTCSLPVNAASTSDTEIETDSAGNTFAAGEELNLDGGSFFGGFAAGKDISISNSNSEDSIAVAGMNIKLDNVATGASAFLAGYDIEINDSDIMGNIMAAGNSISVDSNTESKAVIVAGNEISFDGKAKAASLTASTVNFNGQIDGDVKISADTVTFGSDAKISGKLTVESNKMPSGYEGVTGDFQFIENKTDNFEAKEPTLGNKILDKVKSAIYWAVGMSLVGLLMCLFIKDRLTDSATMLLSKPGVLLGSGAIALISVPVAAILVAITYIGIPVSIITIAVYVFTICLSVAFMGASLGRLVFKNMNGILASILGIVILEFAKAVPVLGTLVGLASTIYTLGYLIQILWQGRSGKKSADVPMIEEKEIIE